MVRMEPPRRWHPKPQVGDRCDVSIDIGADSIGAPRIIMCPRPAAETCWNPRSIMPWVYLCTEHVADLASDGRVIRNPRRRGSR